MIQLEPQIIQLCGCCEHKGRTGQISIRLAGNGSYALVDAAIIAYRNALHGYPPREALLCGDGYGHLDSGADGKADTAVSFDVVSNGIIRISEFEDSAVRVRKPDHVIRSRFLPADASEQGCIFQGAGGVEVDCICIDAAFQSGIIFQINGHAHKLIASQSDACIRFDNQSKPGALIIVQNLWLIAPAVAGSINGHAVLIQIQLAVRRGVRGRSHDLTQGDIRSAVRGQGKAVACGMEHACGRVFCLSRCHTRDIVCANGLAVDRSKLAGATVACFTGHIKAGTAHKADGVQTGDAVAGIAIVQDREQLRFGFAVCHLDGVHSAKILLVVQESAVGDGVVAGVVGLALEDAVINRAAAGQGDGVGCRTFMKMITRYGAVADKVAMINFAVVFDGVVIGALTDPAGRDHTGFIVGGEIGVDAGVGNSAVVDDIAVPQVPAIHLGIVDHFAGSKIVQCAVVDKGITGFQIQGLGGTVITPAGAGRIRFVILAAADRVTVFGIILIVPERHDVGHFNGSAGSIICRKRSGEG